MAYGLRLGRGMRILVTSAILAALCICCGAADESEEYASSESAVRIDRAIASRYGITTFGGPGDTQSQTACGLSGRGLQAHKWYIASSQRYGCKARVRLTTSAGKCVVVSAEDAGPASWVEAKAGVKILDASPDVARHLFGVSGLGWSDIKKNGSKYIVSAEKTTLPLGPCDARATSTPEGEQSPSAVPLEEAEATPTPTPTSGGTKCAADWQCNDDDTDGSGMICDDAQRVCVPGCRRDNQCPGSKTCEGGQCH